MYTEEKIRKSARNQKKSWLRKGATILGALVVFFTTYALILPAITMETPTYCEAEEHVHTSECYSPVLICGNQDEPEVAFLSGPETVRELVCGIEEHTHDETCFDENGTLICEIMEHTHGDACYEEQELEPEEPAHVHTADCYEYVLTCQLPEHTHTLQCFSDPNADTDSTAWEEAADQSVQNLSSADQADTRKRVVAVASSQENYTESQRNYWAAEDGVTQYGYTLYGAAYGAPYAEWNALYVDWVLQKAAVPGFPLNANADEWIRTLIESDQNSGTAYVKNTDPREGDLIFVRTEAASEDTVCADRVGVICSINDKGVYAYEGDYSDKVALAFYEFSDPRIAAYISLPVDEVPADEVPADEAPVEAEPAAQEPVIQEPEVLPEKPAEAIAETPVSPEVRTSEEIAEVQTEYDVPEQDEPAKAPVAEAPAEEALAEAELAVIEPAEAAPAEETPEPETGSEPEAAEAPEKDTPAAPAEAPDAASSPEAEERVFFSDDPEDQVAFPDAVREPAVQNPGSMDALTADPDTIAAMQKIEETAKKENPLQPVADFFGRLLKSGYDSRLTATAGQVTVVAEYNKGVLPAHVSMAVTPVSADPYTDLVAEATGKDDAALLSYDITFLAGNEIVEPEGEVKISFQADFIEEHAEPEIVHIEEGGTAQVIEGTVSDGEISGVTDSFSVYVLSYTVDFFYAVNGREFAFSLPGGGFTSISGLVEALGVLDDSNPEAKEPEAGEQGTDLLPNIAASDAAKEFARNIAAVEFSSPELVWVGKADADTSVGALKEANGLAAEYSTGLTDAQIGEINAQTVEAGDWALISLKPFDTEESLTVTMQNGEVFTIRVTDAQIRADVLVADGKTFQITVDYDEDAEIPEGTKLVAAEIEAGTDDYLQYLGKTWAEVNKSYLEAKEQTGEMPDIPLTNIDSVRFFDLKLMYGNEEIQPKAPVRVEIGYDEGLFAADQAAPGVVHFKEHKVELLTASEADVADNEAVRFCYEQDSFSVIGTYMAQETYDPETPPLGMASDYTRPIFTAARAGIDNAPMEEDIVLGPLALRGSGATETPSDQDDTTKIHKPTGDKTLEPNEDGTYTLTLSVKGASVTEIQKKTKKSNVLFVMDRSSSMITNTVDDREDYWYYGTWSSAEFRQDIGGPQDNKGPNGTKRYQFYGLVNGEYVPLNVLFSGWGTVSSITYNNQWGIPVNYGADDPLYIYSKTTRLSAEQVALDGVIGRLQAYNTETEDAIEIAVISFADHRADTKGWTDTEYTEWASGTDRTDLMNAINDTRYASGTNWEEALQYAYKVISDKKTAEAGKPEEDYYVVFLTDGEPTNKVGDTSAAQHQQDAGNREAYDAAKDDALALVRDGYIFYNIFTFRIDEPVKYSKYLTNYAYSNGQSDYNDSDTDALGTYFSDADTIEVLNDTFNNIFQTIADVTGHADVSITDTLTTDAMTTTVVQGKTNGYVYTVKDPDGKVLYTVTAAGEISGNPTVTFNVPDSATKTYTTTEYTDVGGKRLYSVTTAEGQEYRMALADVNSQSGELEWDLSPVGILLNDCEYSVSFVVWPDQEAYDYVAGLNNGLPGYTWDTSADTYEDLRSSKGYEKGGVNKYPSIVKKTDGTFAVLTNEDQKIHYSVVELETVNGEPNGDPTVHGPYYSDLQTPDPMPLTASESELEKAWNVERDPGILAQLLYDENGNSTEFSVEYAIYRGEETVPYKTMELGWDGSKYAWDPTTVRTVTYKGHQVEVGTRWSGDFDIATGLMLSETRMNGLGLDKTAYQSATFKGTTYYILEPGHDYRIEEIIPEGEESWVTYDFDFVSPIYHPMLVDGVMRSVNYTGFNEAAEEPFSASEDEFTITGMSSAAFELNSLKVENTLRGYINLEKIVVDKDGRTRLPEDSTEFTYVISLYNSTDPGPFRDDSIPWYGVNRLFYHDRAWNYYQAETNTANNKAHRFKLTTESGDVFDAWRSDEYGIETDPSVEFDEDVPGPTWITYYDTNQGRNITIQLFGNQMDFTEGDSNNVSATLPINQNQILNIANVPVGTVYTITEVEQTGYDLVSIRREIRNGTVVMSGSTTTDGSGTVTATIVADRDNHVTYTNKVHSVDITVKKVDENNQALTGATFTLTKAKSGDETENTVYTRPTPEEADTGTYKFINLPDGSYTLHETPPAGYTAVGDVTFTVADGAISQMGTLPNGVTWNGDSLTFTAKNEPNVEDGKLTVRKQWLDYNGNAESYDGTLNLTLHQWVPDDPPEHTVRFYFRCTGNGNGGSNPGQITHIAERVGTGAGDVTVQWDWNRYTQVQPFDVDGLEGSTFTTSSSNDGVEYQSDGRGKRQTLTIHNITKDLTIYILIRNHNYTGTSDNLIYQPAFAGSSDPVENKPTGGTKVITLGTDGVWSRQFTVSGDGLLSDESTTLPATYNGKDCYYSIEENNDALPEGYTLQQISEDAVRAGVLTAYNKRTTEAVKVTVRKVWEDGTNEDGTPTQHPDSLTVTLSNGQSVTLDEHNGWEDSIAGLPKYDHEGEEIVYSWTEESLGRGYYLSDMNKVFYDNEIITTLTNSYTDQYMPDMEIKGVKIWDDGGDENRPESIIVNLYKDGGNAPYKTTTVNAPTGEGADPDQWPFSFTNLPIFNEDGSLCVYTVEEVLSGTYTTDYNTNISAQTAQYEAGTATAHIINSYSDENQLVSEGVDLGYVVVRHGQSYVVWTPRPLQDGELDKIKAAAVKASKQFSGILSASGKKLTIISGVPRTVDVGNKHAASVYMKDGDVWVSFLDPSAESDIVYGSIPYTYTQIGGEGGVTITNVKRTTSVSGTKTWIDGNRPHQNADEITLKLSRTTKPVSDASVWEEVTEGFDFAWNGNRYTYSGLPRYQITEDSQIEYAYRVEETAVAVTEGAGANQHTIQYKMEADGNNFVNTETTNITATKTWKNGTVPVNDSITHASATFTLQKKVGDGDWSDVPEVSGVLVNPQTMAVGETPDANAWTAVWNQLPRYELVENVPAQIAYRVVETAAMLSGENVTPEGETVAAGLPLNIDNTLPEVDLSVTKQWKNGGSVNTDKVFDEQKTISFTLYQKLGTADGTVYTPYGTNGKGTITYTPANGETAASWSTEQIRGLPKYVYASGTWQEASYYVVEDSQSGVSIAYQVDAGEAVDSGSQALAADDATITIINTDALVDLHILKVDAENRTETLSGAVFNIYRKNTASIYETYTDEEIPDGQFTISDQDHGITLTLPSGDYMIEEASSPAGYLITADSTFYFTVASSTVTYTDAGGTEITDDSDCLVRYTLDGDTETFTVGNTPGEELPSTGGAGTRLFTVFGLILLAGAGLLLWRRPRTV